MPDKDHTSALPVLPVSSAIADDSDPLSVAGPFILELIRRTAARKDGFDAPLRERIKALEAQIGHYKEAEHEAALCGTLLIEAQRTLLERTEQARASNRKFVDIAAQLRVANEEVTHLKTVLENKERELSALKKNSAQTASFVRALIAMIEVSRSPATETRLTQ
jgi:predicted RNase H-like nuclease (RuvC/YqgF family)